VLFPLSRTSGQVSCDLLDLSLLCLCILHTTIGASQSRNLRAYTTGGSTQCSESVVSVREIALYQLVHALSLTPHAIGT